MDATTPTEEQLLGQRVRTYREAAGLRQADLGQAVGLDPAAVSRIEAGTRRVTTTELGRIGAALAVSVLALLDDASPLGELAMAARTTQNIGATDTKAHARAQALMELYVTVEDWLPALPTVPRIPVINVNDFQASGEILAEWASDLLGYPVAGEPVRFSTLADRIEERLGVDVLAEPEPGDIDGLTTTMPGVSLVQVNTADARRRCNFTLAHELGHALMAHGSVSLSADPQGSACGQVEFTSKSPVERWCNAFAVSLLVPERTVMASGVDGDNLSGILRVYVESGASWQAVVYRLGNLGYIDADRRDELLASSPLRWASDGGAHPEVRRAVHGVDVSASNEYRAPGRLTTATYEAFLAGGVSARPYADLMRASVEEVLKSAPAATSR